MDGTLTIADVEGGVPAAVARVEAALDRLGVTVFARIDHAAAARAVGLELPDEVVLVFGDPAVGTALMQADPRVGIELPLRLLIWAEGGRTRVGYRDPRSSPWGPRRRPSRRCSRSSTAYSDGWCARPPGAGDGTPAGKSRGARGFRARARAARTSSVPTRCGSAVTRRASPR